MSKTRDLAALASKTSLDEINDAYDAGALSNRNLIINGAMKVAQRGTSFTNNGYTVDRFKVANGSVGNITTTQENTNSPSGVSKYSMKVTATNTASLASGSDGWIRYVIETKDIENLTLSDTTKHFTVSFYVKCSNTGQSSIGVTSGNFSSAQYVYPFTIDNANTWQKVSVAIPCSSLLSNVEGDYGLRLYWDIGSGTNYQTSSTNQWVTGGTYAASGNLQITGVNGRYLQITGVQLEVGDTATPFEHRSYADELAKCQRYYWRQTGTQLYYRFGVGFCTSTIEANVSLSFPQRMRSQPSLSYSGTFAVHHGTGPSVSTTTSIAYDTQAQGVDGTTLVGTTTGLTTGNACQLIANNDSSAYIEFDTEL